MRPCFIVRSHTRTNGPVFYKTSFSATRIRRSAYVGVTCVSLGLAGLSCGGTDGTTTGPGNGAATTIALSVGNTQTAIAGAATAVAPAVIVTNAGGTGVAGVSVTFTVASGGGSVTSGTQTTNASGIATVGSWTLGTTAGANTMTVTSTGLTGSPVTFSATGIAGPAAAVAVNAGNTQTAVAGRLGPLHLRTVRGCRPDSGLRERAHRLKAAALRAGSPMGCANAPRFCGLGHCRNWLRPAADAWGLRTAYLSEAVYGQARSQVGSSCPWTPSWPSGNISP